MSQRVHSNIGWPLSRKLGRPFGSSDKAIGTTAPNSLSGGPSIHHAMGRAGKAGLVTFVHDGASQVFNFYYWSEKIGKWILLGAVAAEFSKTVDPDAAMTFTIPEDCYFFIQAVTSTCTNCWTGGASKAEANPTADL